MDNLEQKAQEMLDANKAKTIEEAKSLIVEAQNQLEGAIEKKNQEWQVKFDAMDKEVQEYKSQAELLKQKNEEKTVHFNDALKEAMSDPENVEKFEKFRRKEIKEVSFELKAVGDMSLSNITDLAAANVQMLPGIIPVPNRKRIS